MEGIEDSYTRETTAVLLENQARHVLAEQAKSGLLEESTTVGQLGTFQKFAFPLVRRVFPELIANKVVGVQPMQGPVSQVFYLGFDRSHNGTAQSVYGKYLLTYKNLTADPLATSGLGVDLGSESVGWDHDNSNASVPNFSSTVSGAIGKDIAAYPNTGTLSQWSTSAGEALTGAEIPEINFHIEQQAITAHTRKFRALWTIEAAQDLKAYHNLDLERELTDLLGKEVALEIDREILEDLRMVAYDVTGDINTAFDRQALDLGNPNNFPGHGKSGNTWNEMPATDFTFDQDAGLASAKDAGDSRNVYFVDMSNTVGLNLTPRHAGEAYSNLLAVVNFAAQDIYKTTWRGAGNYIITSPLVAAMLSSAAKLEGGINEKEAGQLGANITYKGKWAGAYDVYVDPLWPEDEMLIGYKGSNPMECGYVYAPYIPVQMLPTIVDPDTFQPRKGLITRYGKTAITPASRWYRVVRLVGNTTNWMNQPFSRITATDQAV